LRGILKINKNICIKTLDRVLFFNAFFRIYFCEKKLDKAIFSDKNNYFLLQFNYYLISQKGLTLRRVYVII